MDVKNFFGKRILGIFVSVVMLVGVFASPAAVTADAALTDEQNASVYEITINDVTRKYPMAKQLLDGINTGRSSRGLASLRMDSSLLEQAMVRAAELPMYFSKYSLMEDDYSLRSLEYDDYASCHYSEGVFIVRGTVSEAVAAFFDDPMYKNTVLSSYVKEIGIGAVSVGTNGVTFVCLRTTDEMTQKGTYGAVNSSVYSAEKEVEQVTRTLGKNMDLQDPPVTLTTQVGKRTVVNFDVHEVQGLGYQVTIKPGYLNTSVLNIKKLCIDEVEPNVFTPAKTGSNMTLRMIIDAEDEGVKISKSISVTVEEGEEQPETELVNECSINSSYVTTGTRTRMFGAASGGSGEYTYAYYYKKTTAKYWKTLGTEYGTDTLAVVTLSIGDFDIRISVKDSKGNVADKTFKVNVSDGKSAAFENNSTISTTGTKSEVRVFFYGAASDSTCRYAYYYKRTTARAWTVLGTEFGTQKTVAFTPKSEGEFNVKIDAINDKNESVSRVYALSVDDNYNDTGIVSAASISAATLTVGNRLIITGSATGGTAPYTYGYFYKQAGARNWSQIGDYTESTKAGIKLRNAVDYIVKVVTKDSAGGMVSENFDVTVTE